MVQQNKLSYGGTKNKKKDQELFIRSLDKNKGHLQP